MNSGSRRGTPAASSFRPHNTTLRLERNPIEVLFLLVEPNGRLVRRKEISERLWDKDVFVDAEHGINTAIRTAWFGMIH